MKTCPYCAEEIQEAAVKCKHCGEVVVGDEWRAFCERYSKLPPAQQKTEWEGLSPDQRTHFSAAWSALEFDKAPAPPAEEKKTSTASVGWLVLLVLVAFLIMIMSFGSGGSGRSGRSSAPKQAHSELDAWGMCREFVEESLKAPRTAKFPWGYSKFTTHLGGGKYRVRAYVDAQNSFGALVRSDFDCTVQYAGEDRWRLENLAID